MTPPYVPGGYDIELSSGGFLDLSRPDGRDIKLGDVARGLSQMCRFSGQCSRFYSVAEHCLLVAWRLEAQGHPRDVCLAGLHHDDGEAFVCDIPRPLKHLLPAYRDIEDRVFAVVVEALGLGHLPFTDPAVKEADNWALAQEAQALMPSGGRHWFTADLAEGAPWELGVVAPNRVRVRWVQRHYALTTEANGGMNSECLTCGEGVEAEREQCPHSQHSCGHHCNHTWTHDTCCWCGAVFGDMDDPDFGKPQR